MQAGAQPIRLLIAGLATLSLFALFNPHPAHSQDQEAASGLLEFDSLAAERKMMVTEQLEIKGIHDAKVLQAMRDVPRHLFVPNAERKRAYTDSPLPIGYGQTISQPYIVALMTQVLNLGKDDKVLEIGTGSGYQSAILGELAGEVYTIEIVDELARRAADTLRVMNYSNVEVRSGDGYKGWPEKAPFDAIIVTAAPPQIPQTLVDQLKEGGRMVIPVGEFFQNLKLLTKENGEIREEQLVPVLFVPMVKKRD